MRRLIIGAEETLGVPGIDAGQELFGVPEQRMVNSRLIDAYHEAIDAYEAAKAGVGCRAETFTRFLVAERILLVCLGRPDHNLQEFRAGHSPRSTRPGWRRI
jgi:hypothetical protein